MFELWDGDSRNVIRFFESASEADDILSNHVRNYGPAILDGLALIHEDEHENSELIAEGRGIPTALKRLRNDGSPATAPSGPAPRIAG